MSEKNNEEYDVAGKIIKGVRNGSLSGNTYSPIEKRNVGPHLNRFLRKRKAIAEIHDIMNENDLRVSDLM